MPEFPVGDRAHVYPKMLRNILLKQPEIHSFPAEPIADGGHFGWIARKWRALP
jgi:hypothetical protein